MLNFKKFTCSVLAALAIANTALALPSDTSKMPNNVINAMAVNKKNPPLEHAICTKQMNTRKGPGTQYDKTNKPILAGSMLDLSEVTKNDIYVNPKNPNNVWVRHFYVCDATIRQTDYFDNNIWVCISNSSIKVPNYINNDKIISIYSKPDTKSSKTDVKAYLEEGGGRKIDEHLYVTNIQRINNQEWGKITYLDLRKNKTTTGYVLMCTLSRAQYRWYIFNNVWYDNALYD